MRNSMLRRVATVATTLGLTTLGLFGTGAAPAQAAIRDCPSGYFCAWKSDNGTGTMYKTNVNRATLGTWDNTFRSVVNRTNKYACLYDGANYGDDAGAAVLPPDPAGTEWGGPGGNSVSSVKFVPTERECVLPPYPAWAAYTAPKAAGFGDMNADRKSDVIVRDEAGRLWFLPGDNTGRLVGTGGWNAMSTLTRHGDFSGDGREDVVAREKATGKLWLYPGTGTGALGSRKLIGSGGWNAMNHVTAFGNLTGDARSDLLAVEKSTGKLWLYPGTAGGLGARKLIGSGGWNTMNALVGPGDMNGDNRPDLIAREAANGRLWFYPGTAAGGVGARVLIGSGGWNAMASFLPLGDLNADGRNDLATLSNSSYVGEGCRGVGCLVLYPGKGTGALYAGAPEDENWMRLNAF